MNKRRQKILSITTDAMFLAIIFLMAYTQIGFIPLGVISVTIIHVPVLVGAYLFGYKKGALYGLFFGLVSLFKALENPASILDPFFQNPLISVLPRVVFGLLSGLLFDGIKKISKKQIVVQPLIFISGFVLTVLHSVMVLGTLGLLNSETLDELLTGYYASYWAFMGITLGTSSLLEALFGGIITPLVSYPLQKFVYKDKLFTKQKEISKENNEKISGRINSYSKDRIDLDIIIKK